MGDGDAGGRWVEDPVLPELPAPPTSLIRVRGAQLLRVYNVDSSNRGSRRGYTDTVALAWARLPEGGWALLAAWQGSWRGQGGRTTGRARWGWVRLLQDRVEAVERPPRIEGFAWFGWAEDSALGEAVRAAALLLPEHLRKAALTPKAPPDPGLTA